MKVVINRCWGGFGLSEAATQWLKERGVEEPSFAEPAFRCNPLLVEVVEQMGEAVNDASSNLAIVEIPFDSAEGWWISDYDGKETVVGREGGRWNGGYEYDD